MRKFMQFFILAVISSVLVAGVSSAREITDITPPTEKELARDNCLLTKLKLAAPHTSVAEIKAACDVELIPKAFNRGVVSKRVIAEREVEFNPYVITPHKMNYILPAVVTDSFNQTPYQAVPEFANNFEDIEAKYQISLKVPLTADDIFTDNDKLYFGLTVQSWWQIYANNISKPFRETNYQPEIMYFAPTDWHPFDGNVAVIVGLEHQSNGRSQLLSRSWNRVYSEIVFEKGNFAASLRPWYRIKEEHKKTPTSAKGDDNPDILDYMGHFELGLGYKWHHYEFTALGRQNFATHKGALELGVTFPLWGKLEGYLQYFSGYGESLIDYNHSQHKVGLGIALSNYF
jgi:phospholipase A1